MNVQEEASACSPSPMVSAFLIKTYQLVDDASTDHVVSWGKDHTTFVVWNPSEMARIVLPFFFKHNNFFGFVMQLNLYGFRKIAPDRWEFANDFFRKGAKHLLCKIQGWKTEKAALTGPPLKNSADDQHYCGCNDFVSFSPPSLSPMMSPAEEALGIAIFSSESEKLAREGHAKLLFELTRIRCLYEESLSVIRQQHHPQKESNGPQKCVACSRVVHCQRLQHQHGGDFTFQVLDDSARKEDFCIRTGSPSLENGDINMPSMNSRQNLLIGSIRENRDKSCPTMTSVHSSCAQNDLTFLTPASQSPMILPACVEAGREPLSLLTENNRLRRDNAILLSELNHARKLYTEALLIIEIQKNRLEEANVQQQHPLGIKIGNSQCGAMDGHFVDPAAAHSFDATDAMHHKKDFTVSPQDEYPAAKKLRGCQDTCERLPQVAAFDIMGEENSFLQSMKGGINAPVRLFGVPLQSSKKRRRDEDLCGMNDSANTGSDDDEVVIIKVVKEDRLLEKMPSLKSVTVDSLGELEEPTSRSIL